MQYLAVIVKASRRCLATILLTAATIVSATCCSLAQETSIPPSPPSPLHWHACPPIPDALGIAGPIVGVHNNILIAGGGANFALPVWESSKRWHNKLYALDLEATPLAWCELPPMPAAWGYSACISTRLGIVVIGGNDSEKTLKRCWLIQLQRQADATARNKISAEFRRLPDLPQPLANAQAAYINDSLLVCTGQTANELSTATAALWQLPWPFDQREIRSEELARDGWQWQAKQDHPGGPRSFAQVTRLQRSDSAAASREAGHNTHDDALVVIGGRRQVEEEVRFLSDTWIYEPKTDQWHRKSDAPVAITAGSAGSVRPNQIAVISGDDGRLFSQTDQLRDHHPGFARRAWIYDAGRDIWTGSFETPANQVTTTAVSVGSDLWLVSGEIRPRVRTPNVWKISVVQLK